MNVQVLQRSEWYGEPKELGDCFRVSKKKGGRVMTSVCRLFTHQFGWELFLETNGLLHESAVCRTKDDVFTTFEEWKAAMVKKGWA
jgi:hypothetical protein